jgi:hypothetical protein
MRHFAVLFKPKKKADYFGLFLLFWSFFIRPDLLGAFWDVGIDVQTLLKFSRAFHQ